MITPPSPAADDARPSPAGLVTRAQGGDQEAWNALVERYAPLLWSICRRYRLAGPDAADISQNVWLRLATRLDTLRDPAALGGWLATTTRRECARARRAAARPQAAVPVPGIENIPDSSAETAEQQLLAAERHAALREALASLPPGCQRLIALLIADPPVPYAAISAELGIPAGSIGPTRARCLDKLRRHPALAALIDAAAETPHHEPRRPRPAGRSDPDGRLRTASPAGSAA